MRRLREKHKIPISQLARLSTVNRQRLTQIELEDKVPTEHMRSLVDSAISRVIEERRRELAELEADYARHRGRLLDYIDKEDTP